MSKSNTKFSGRLEAGGSMMFLEFKDENDFPIYVNPQHVRVVTQSDLDGFTNIYTGTYYVTVQGEAGEVKDLVECKL
jgi:hypothetical protein